MYIGCSERLAIQNLQISNTAETRIYQSGSFHPASKTKIGLFPAVRMLYLLLPSLQNLNTNRLAMKGGGGFIGVAGGN